jgi:hypothetical protein
MCDLEKKRVIKCEKDVEYKFWASHSGRTLSSQMRRLERRCFVLCGIALLEAAIVGGLVTYIYRLLSGGI